MPGQAIVTIKDRQWACSVAGTPAELATGLSGVPSIPPGTGMLFVLPQEQIVTVTAENMLFPLSVIFISENLLVTEVAPLLSPGDWGTTNLPCRYFLEVNAGEADGIESGNTVSIQITQAPGTADWIAPVVTLAGVAMMGVMMVKMGRAMSGAMLGKPKERPVLYGPKGERLLPQTGKRKPTRQEVEIGTWVERDRIGIWITDKRTDKTVAEWWDEDAREMFEQGWFKPGDIRHQTITGRAFEESVLDYAESMGLLAGSGKYLAQTIKDAYYWTAINKDTGEIVESHAPYTSSVRALRGGKAFASRHWKVAALVEVWKQPHRYSEGLQIQPVASEIVTPDKLVAVIPTEPRRPRREDELEFLPDSPEFLAYTIEDIGYREKIDNAFLGAIARARGG